MLSVDEIKAGDYLLCVKGREWTPIPERSWSGESSCPQKQEDGSYTGALFQVAVVDHGMLVLTCLSDKYGYAPEPGTKPTILVASEWGFVRSSQEHLDYRLKTEETEETEG